MLLFRTTWLAPAFFLIILGVSARLPAGDAALPRNVLPALPGPAATYKVRSGIDGEIYPAFANYASLQNPANRRFGIVTVTVSNPTTSPLRQQIAVQVPGWSDREIQTAELAPGAVETLLFAPSFLPRFYQNREIVAATATISVTDAAGRSLYETTAPVRLRSSEDMYWGNGFQNAPFIASWVTPHDPMVESLLAKAKQRTPDHRLPGYEEWKTAAQQERETWLEAKAIYTALQASGLSYVKSSTTLGGHQDFSERVRMPRVSLRNASANCIDAAVTYASLFENLGMDAEVVIVPGHAYAGVRVASGSPRFLVIDVALTGRATFEAAVASAKAGLTRRGSSEVTQVLIPESRNGGIYPMP
jgi:hypothetical protein